MLYQIKDLTVTLGEKEVFSHADFFIKGNEKIALVGQNGAGKTTLLKVIAGEIIPDRDDKRKEEVIMASRKLTVGTLSQNPFSDTSITFSDALKELFDETDEYSQARYELEQRLDRLMCGLGFEKENRYKQLSEFSGGELTRLGIIKLLLREPDICLLDEPTNHLDMEGIEWLEDYLKSYGRSVIIVSHDRLFLDRVADITVEVADKKLIRYTGGYSDYKREKELQLERAKKSYEQYEAEKKRLTDLQDRFRHKPTKAAFVRAKKKQLERIPVVQKPSEEATLDIKSLEQPDYLGPKWIYEAEDLKVGYSKPMFNLTFRIKRGQKLAVIGENGSGKTTLLKTVAGLIPAISGKQNIGNKVLLGYYDQNSSMVKSEKTVLEHYHELYPSLTEADLRKKLAMWLFKGRDVYKQVNDLSGGEKSRLILAELLQGLPNFLVLDEPTNHMDIPAKEALEKVLGTYNGTQLIVSHDRYFLSKVADSMLIIKDGEINYYPFGYEHYLEQKRKLVYADRLPGELSAEDAALLSRLQNVPKKNPIQTRQLTTEEAYEDWVMSQADLAMEKAYLEYEEAMMQYADINSQRIAEQKLTDSCLEWYEKYLELH